MVTSTPICTKYDDIPYRILFHDFIGDPSFETQSQTIQFVCRAGVECGPDKTRLIAEKINRELCFVKAITCEKFISIEYVIVIVPQGAKSLIEPKNLWCQILDSVLNIIVTECESDRDVITESEVAESD